MQNFLSLIFFRIFRSMLYSTAALTFCAWIVQSSKYMSMLNVNVTLAKFFKFTSLLSVDIVAFILPIALAVSSAFVYYRLAESNQIIVLQSAGISPKKLLRPLIMLATLCSGYVYISNAYLSPMAFQTFRKMEHNIKNNIEPPAHAGLIFAGDNFSVYSQQYLGNLFFGRVFIIDSRNPQKTQTLSARLGSIDKNILSLIDGERIEIDFQTKKNTSTTFRSYSYDMKDVFRSYMRNKGMNECFINELAIVDQDTKEIAFEKLALLHKKILASFLPILFALFAFGIVVFAPYSRKKNHNRIAILITIIIMIKGIFLSFANIAITNPMFSNFNYCVILSLFVIALFVARIFNHE